MRIALYKIMVIGLDTFALQSLTEGCGSWLTVVMSDDHGAHHKATLLKLAPQSEHILVIGDAEVSPLLVLLNVSGTNHHYNLDAVT